jgi:hypothetical protein
MKSNQSLLTAMVLFLLSLVALQGVLLLNARNTNVLGVTIGTGLSGPIPPISTAGIPCSLISNWQSKYCSNSVPTPTPAVVSCETLYSSQNSVFASCYKSGFPRICFDKFTGVYQGCVSGTVNTCTQNNTNAARNLLCLSGPATTTPTSYPRSTPIPTVSSGITGKIWLDGSGTYQAGQSLYLYLSTSSPNPIQMIGTSFTSTCNISDLPAGFVGNPNQTTETHSWYVTISPTTPVGQCTIYTKVWPSNHPEQTFPISYTFNVVNSKVTPTLAPMPTTIKIITPTLAPKPTITPIPTIK